MCSCIPVFLLSSYNIFPFCGDKEGNRSFQLRAPVSKQLLRTQDAQCLFASEFKFTVAESPDWCWKRVQIRVNLKAYSGAKTSCSYASSPWSKVQEGVSRWLETSISTTWWSKMVLGFTSKAHEKSNCRSTEILYPGGRTFGRDATRHSCIKLEKSNFGHVAIFTEAEVIYLSIWNQMHDHYGL